MSTGMTTEEKAACFDKLVELMLLDSQLVAIQATVNGKTIRASIGFFGEYCVNHRHPASFMDMLLEFERQVKA